MAPESRVERNRPHIPEKVHDLDHEAHYSDTSRIKALSDGVFSIAMTLLAFTLIAIRPKEAATPQAFWDEFHVPLLVYAMSFILLGTYWVAHAIAFHYIVRSDRPLMVTTVIYLVFVSLVPFTTDYLGSFPYDRLAIGIYCANLILCGLALQQTLLYATKDPIMLNPVFDRRIFRGTRLALAVGPILFAVAFVVSMFNAVAGFVVCVAVPILTFFPNPFWGRLYRRFYQGRQPAQEP
jgi:uncharacterized membrane protein